MTKSQRRQVIVFGMAAVAGVAVFAGISNSRIPATLRIVLTIAMLVLGILGILVAVLLKLRYVQPGRIWGFSSPGSLLMAAGVLVEGIGLFALDLGDYAGLVRVTGLLALSVGALVNSRARGGSGAVN